MGHWIGGDRDGNPNVTAATLPGAARQAEVALRHYLTEVHELGAELSISLRLTGVSPEMQALAERSPTTTSTAGRALPPRADRHVRAPGRHAAELTGTEALRHAVAARTLPPPRSCWPTCGHRGLAARHHGEALIPLRLAPLMRAVQVFGFHLATLDLRQSSTSTRPWSPNCWPRRASRPTTRAGRSRQARAAAAPAERRPPLRVIGARYTEQTPASWPSSSRARGAARYGREALRHYIISHTETVRPAGSAAAAEGGRPAARRAAEYATAT
jgi:phosphoenolpyruvate carboxylase